MQMVLPSQAYTLTLAPGPVPFSVLKFKIEMPSGTVEGVTDALGRTVRSMPTRLKH